MKEKVRMNGIEIPPAGGIQEKGKRDFLSDVVDADVFASSCSQDAVSACCVANSSQQNAC